MPDPDQELALLRGFATTFCTSKMRPKGPFAAWGVWVYSCGSQRSSLAALSICKKSVSIASVNRTSPDDGELRVYPQGQLAAVTKSGVKTRLATTKVKYEKIGMAP
jgi:hypothetical protein